MAALPVRVSGWSRPSRSTRDRLVHRGVRRLPALGFTPRSVTRDRDEHGGLGAGVVQPAQRHAVEAEQVAAAEARGTRRRRRAARSRRARRARSRRATRPRRRAGRRRARPRRPAPRTLTASSGSPKAANGVVGERDDLGDRAAGDRQHVERHRAERVRRPARDVVGDRGLAVGAGERRSGTRRTAPGRRSRPRPRRRRSCRGRRTGPARAASRSAASSAMQRRRAPARRPPRRPPCSAPPARGRRRSRPPLHSLRCSGQVLLQARPRALQRAS